MRSLRSRLSVLFALSLAACLAVALLLVRLSGLSGEAVAGRQQGELRRACELIQESYGFYAAGWSGPSATDDPAAFGRDLADVVLAALPRAATISGGVWRSVSGVLAYVPPGGASGAALPAAGAAAVAAAAGAAVQDGLPASGGGGTLLVEACALGGPVAGLAAFAVGRLDPGAANGLWLGLAVLLLLVVAMAGWLSLLVRRWGAHVRAIEAALAGHAAGSLPVLPATGERELDRIIAALNATSVRLGEARAAQAAMQAQVAASERLAALGRVAAGVAHEIRNPIAAMRLRAEGGLSGDDPRRRAALAAVLTQVSRLERLAAELLAMTQRHVPVCQPTELGAFLASVAADHPGCIRVAAPAMQVALDSELIRRALDNLLRNATAEAGVVRVTAAAVGAELEVRVADDGPGVAVDVVEHLFEPFVTGRADGTGLGLPIARELIESHGGRLWLADAGGDGRGATFAFTLPLDGPWPGS